MCMCMCISLSISLLEVYNEELFDLLITHNDNKYNDNNNHHHRSNGFNTKTTTKPTTKPLHLHIVENTNGEIEIPGLTEVRVSSVEDVIEAMKIGSSHRSTGMISDYINK